MLIPARQPHALPVRMHQLAGAVQRINTRNFFRLAGVNQRFDLPPIVLSGNFTLTLKTTLPENGGYFLSDRNSTDAYQRLGITADGRLFGMLADGSFGSATSRPDDVINTIVISRSGTTLSAYLNGVEIYSRQSAMVFIINSIGAPYNGSTSIPHLNGVVQSFHVAGDNITSGGEPVDELFYPLDDSPDDFPVIRNESAGLGANLSVLSEYLSSVPIGSGPVTSYVVGPVSAGLRYLLECDVSNYIGTDSVGVFGENGLPFTPITEDGSIRLVFTAAADFSVRLFSRASNQCVFSNIKLRRATGYGTFINGSIEAYGEFIEQDNGDWLGSDLSIPPWDSESQLIEVAE